MDQKKRDNNPQDQRDDTTIYRTQETVANKRHKMREKTNGPKRQEQMNGPKRREQKIDNDAQ
jgi:hypothetical protein